LLSLLVPLFFYLLALKAYEFVSLPGGAGLVGTLYLMWSDLFFGLGYALLSFGLFAAVRRGPLRWAVVFFFHASAMVVVVVTTCAHPYFQEIGTMLDYGAGPGWAPELDEIASVLTHDVPLAARMLLFVTLLYVALGPLLVTRATRLVGRRGWRIPGASSSPVTPDISFSGALAFFAMALAFGSLSLLVGPGSEDAEAPSARDRFDNAVLTGLREAFAIEEEEAEVQEPTVEEEAAATEEDAPGAGPITEGSAMYAGLAPTSRTEARNVVLIHLESTRARSATPYNQDLKTMPFMNELARSSLLAERAYAVVPRSSKGSTAVNCGVEPPHYPGPEFEPGRIPSPCLGGLLKEQGYRTVYFQSVSDVANDRWDGVLARNFGYEDFYPPETMNREGFQVTNSFGYEEDIMLGPSEGWLLNFGYDRPFLAQYFTGTGHYGYECVPNRYGYERFSEDEELDRYHNCLRILDHFLENLFDQYKRLGLYQDTIFVLYGDHGEGFRKHKDRYMHGDTIYEEGLRIPLIIHDPKRFQGGERVAGLSSQIDVLPTVVEMLGYEVVNGDYPGYSLLHPLPENRIIRANCISNRKCMASIKGFEKYIYNYGDQPDEFFDLSEDPLEKNNLADERGEEEIDERRNDLLGWRQRDNAEYGPITFEGTPYQGAAP
jgi:lipoteichoic acid synthase